MPGCSCARAATRTDTSIAISKEDKERLICEAAADGVDLKKHLAKILRVYWGRD